MESGEFCSGFHLGIVALDFHRREVTMPSAKEQIAKILQDQPDDSSYDEILRELAFARMVEKGLVDSDAGRTISHEEMGRRIKTWRN